MAEGNKKVTINELLERNVVDTKSNDISKGSYFCTYRTADVVKKIIGFDESYFFLNSIENMNDEMEKRMHADQAKTTYALCFCHSDTENIPLWYLYGGITGKGACIRLTADKFQLFLQSIQYVHPVVMDENNNMSLKKDIILYPNKDYEMSYGWVYYCKAGTTAESSSTIIKHRNNVYELASENWEDFQNHNYFIKDYAWNYEKEFRIVFHFFNKAYDMIAVPFPKQNLLNGLRIKFAPNFPSEEISKYKSELGLNDDRFSQSKLQIRFDLIKRNHDSLIQSFPEIVQDSCDTDLITMCNSLQRRRNCSNDAENLSTERDENYA